MRLAFGITLLAFSCAIPASEAGPAGKTNTLGVSSGPMGVRPETIEPGAVYQEKLRLRPGKVEDYVKGYAKWYLPIDQFPCSPATKTSPANPPGCETSGRKLVSVLTRQFGDEYNLVFLYRYESAFKEYYYCQYPKTFLKYHNTKLEAEDPYKKALAGRTARGLKALTVAAAIQLLPPDCTQPPSKDQELALEFAKDVLYEFDVALFKDVDADESSWYFDVNLCTVAGLKPPKDAAKPVDGECPESRLSVLERAMSLAWDNQPWMPKAQPKEE